MCVNRLLQNWLRTFEGNILELLKCLDVENSLETAEKMLFMLFKKVPHHELIQNFDLLNEQWVKQHKATILMFCHKSSRCNSFEIWIKRISYMGAQSSSELQRLDYMTRYKVQGTSPSFSQIVSMYVNKNVYWWSYVPVTGTGVIWASLYPSHNRVGGGGGYIYIHIQMIQLQ